MPTHSLAPTSPGLPRRVAILVESSGASGREILRGIARYARQAGPWSIYQEPGHLEEKVPGWLRGWTGEGIIARIRNRSIARSLARLRRPVVDVLGNLPQLGLPLVQVDDDAVGCLAAEHFLERGFRHFAFCGIAGPVWSSRRGDAFLGAVGENARSCQRYELPIRGSREWSAESERRRLATWVSQLPKPMAVMAANDVVGQRVLDACRRVGRLVPEEAAVLGVDNDETVCGLCDPLLSSVIPVHDQIGYEAAALLERLMDGERPPAAPWYLKPSRIVVRRSSDVLALEDTDVAAAVRYIRAEACRGVTVEDVARHVALSYSTLRRRFQTLIGRTVHDEIVRCRMARVQELLLETSLPLAKIAEAAGFEHQEYLGAVFKAQTGQTLKQYRQGKAGSGE